MLLCLIYYALFRVYREILVSEIYMKIALHLTFRRIEKVKNYKKKKSQKFMKLE